MKKNSGLAWLLLLIAFASLGQPSVQVTPIPPHHPPHYQLHDSDSAESPDEFLRSGIREIKP